jgi:hypothetical protein
LLIQDPFQYPKTVPESDDDSGVVLSGPFLCGSPAEMQQLMVQAAEVVFASHAYNTNIHWAASVKGVIIRDSYVRDRLWYVFGC